MKRERNLFLITVAILGLAWLAVVLLLCKNAVAVKPGVIGLVFGVLGFVLAGVMNILPEKASAGNDSSSLGVSITGSAVYLGVSVLLNSALLILANQMQAQFPWGSTLALILNIAILACYLVFMLYAHAYIGKLQKKSRDIRTQTATPAAFSTTLGRMLATTDHPEVKAALRKLKETVDYSSTRSSSKAEPAEKAFSSSLDAINGAILNGSDAKSVLRMIDSATQIWRSRNTSVN